MPEPTDMIIPMLQDMREENRFLHAETRRELAQLTARMEAVEKTQRSFKAGLTTDTMLSRFVIGDFEERLSDLERRVSDLSPPTAV